MKLLLYMPLMLLFSLTVIAQQPKEKVKFASVNSLGLLAGSRGEALSIQTIAGLKVKKWFAGIGTGLDFYEVRTIPLFADVRWQLRAINTPYIYGDIGTNFLWLKTENQFQQSKPGSSSPQLYYETGIGYKLYFANKKAMFFSAGYNTKQVKQSFKSFFGAPTFEFQEGNYDHYKSVYRRVVIRLGLEL